MTAYISGVGKTKFGPTQKTIPQLAQEASLEALRDAGLGIEDVDAIIVANFLGGPNERQLHLNSVVAGIFPGVSLPSWRVEAACASGGVAVHQGVLSLSQYNRILVVGVEKLSAIGGTELTRNIGMAGDYLLDQIHGLTFPASYALLAQQHFARWGTTPRDLELVSLKNHINANSNPLAHFSYKIVTQADIDSAPMVASPLRLFDCCPVSDGAAAVVLEKEKRTPRSVEVLASSVSSDAISLVQRKSQTSFKAAQTAAHQAYQQANLAASDIDFAEVHDCFTIAEIVAIEDLGFADEGKGAELVRAGATQRDGGIPVNSSGGLKAGGHAIGATGIGQLYELAKQVRGEAETRQLEKARYGLAHNVGGIGGTCSVTIVGGE